MEKIRHSIIPTNGINIHMAEIGDGPAVLFLHGFPELWYSWRHQMLHPSSKGYRTITPDLHGYGDSDAPSSASGYTIFHIIGDLLGVLDALGLDQVFLVGHDWGAYIAWYFCLLRPDRIKALVNMSVVFQSRNPKIKPVDAMRAAIGEDFYICRFQCSIYNTMILTFCIGNKLMELFWGFSVPGEAESDFARLDTATLIKKFLTSRNPSPPRVPKEVGFGGSPHKPIIMPPWLSEDDVKYYADKFDKKGFTGGLNYYRVLNLNWELLAPYAGLPIKVPVKFVVGDLDITYNTPGVKDYIHGDRFKKHVPLLQELVIMEGVAHFINQEKPHEISQHIVDFIQKF